MTIVSLSVAPQHAGDAPNASQCTISNVVDTLLFDDADAFNHLRDILALDDVRVLGDSVHQFIQQADEGALSVKSDNLISQILKETRPTETIEFAKNCLYFYYKSAKSIVITLQSSELIQHEWNIIQDNPRYSADRCYIIIDMTVNSILIIFNDEPTVDREWFYMTAKRARRSLNYSTISTSSDTMELRTSRIAPGSHTEAEDENPPFDMPAATRKLLLSSEIEAVRRRRSLKPTLN